jgi:hypothetical protein
MQRHLSNAKIFDFHIFATQFCALVVIYIKDFSETHHSLLAQTLGDLFLTKSCDPEHSGTTVRLILFAHHKPDCASLFVLGSQECYTMILLHLIIINLCPGKINTKPLRLLNRNTTVDVYVAGFGRIQPGKETATLF